MFGNHKGERVEQGYEEENDKGVAEGEQKGREEIVRQRATAVRRGTQLGTGTISIETEHKQQDATHQLEDINGARLFDKFHHETHAKTGDKGIEDIADGGTKTRDQAVVASLVERTLNTQHAYRSHRGTGHHTDDESLDGQIQ